MSPRTIAALSLFALSFAPGAALAAGDAGQPSPFVASVPLRDATAEVRVDFHSDHATMVPCTPEQAAIIGARGLEHLTELLPVLNARVAGRKTASEAPIEVLFDAACYDGGIMALGGYGRGDQGITLPYEESTDGAEWGPPKKGPPVTDPQVIAPPAEPDPEVPAPPPEGDGAQ